QALLAGVTFFELEHVLGPGPACPADKTMSAAPVALSAYVAVDCAAGESLGECFDAAVARRIPLKTAADAARLIDACGTAYAPALASRDNIEVAPHEWHLGVPHERGFVRYWIVKTDDQGAIVSALWRTD